MDSIQSIKFKKALEEQAKRKGIKKFKPEDLCFKRQLQFINDPSRYKIACTGRRGGKTYAAIADLIDTALTEDRSELIFITETRGIAKDLAWRSIKDINETYKLNGKTDENDLSITFPNKSIIFLKGANDEGEVRKLRGRRFKKIYIDETQNLRSSILKELIEEVLSKTIYDYRDTSIIFLGTPGKVLSGYWYDLCFKRQERFKNYSFHHWTIADNEKPLEKSGLTGPETLALVAEEEGEDLNNPSDNFRKEWLGEWISIADSNILNYDPKINEYSGIPQGDDWRFVMAIDCGHDDSDAIVVLGFSSKSNDIYLFHEYQRAKQDWLQLGQVCMPIYEQYNPFIIVADTGGGGKKGIETIKNAFHLPIIPASKTEKNDWLQLLNKDLKEGRLRLKDEPGLGECCIKDMDKLIWGSDKEGRLRVRGHSDILDALLYAWRSCYYITHQKKHVKPEVVSPTDFQAWSDLQMKKKLKEVQRQQKQQYWQRWK